MTLSNPPWTSLPRYQGRPRWQNREQKFWVDGHAYVGITTILQATKPLADRQRLQAWRRETGVEAAQKIASDASRRGKRLHQLTAQYLSGDATEQANLATESWDYWRSLLPLLETITNAPLIEALVWHPDGYAGSLDALVEIDGKLCLCDWKTATKPKRWDWITDYCLQVAAYITAANYVYTTHGLAIEQGLVAIALPDTEVQCFWLNAPELEAYQCDFEQRLAQFKA